jgi:hypothetical protein
MAEAQESENDRQLAYEFRDDQEYRDYTGVQLQDAIAKRIIDLYSILNGSDDGSRHSNLKRIIFLFENLDPTNAKNLREQGFFVTEVTIEGYKKQLRIFTDYEYILGPVENDITRLNTLLGRLLGMGCIVYNQARVLRQSLHVYYLDIIACILKPVVSRSKMRTILRAYESEYQAIYDYLTQECPDRVTLIQTTKQYQHANLYDLYNNFERSRPAAAPPPTASDIHIPLIPLGGNKTKKYTSKPKGKGKTKSKGKGKTKSKGKSQTKSKGKSQTKSKK